MSNRLRIRAAAQEIDSARFYRLIAETIPNMVWSSRADGWNDYFNGHVLAYTGRTQQQLEGWGWRSIVHSEDLDRCMDRWAKALKSGQDLEIEYRLKQHDGIFRWHLGAAAPSRDSAGRVIRWFGTCTDIEEQKKSGRLLERARKTLDALVAIRAAPITEPDYRLRTLSARELQVLELIVNGRTSAEVAAELSLSPKSVDTDRSRLMAKLNIENLPALVKFAIRYGLTTNS